MGCKDTESSNDDDQMLKAFLDVAGEVAEVIKTDEDRPTRTAGTCSWNCCFCGLPSDIDATNCSDDTDVGDDLPKRRVLSNWWIK